MPKPFNASIIKVRKHTNEVSMAKTSSRFAALFFFTTVSLSAAPASAETKLLRFPDVYGSRVIFCHGGDIWQASTDGGGVAKRLSAHRGDELFPKFSPDGKWIAFTGQYDGDGRCTICNLHLCFLFRC